MPSFYKLAITLAAIIYSSVLYAQTQYPLTVIDGLGTEITLKKPPVKVSSKTLFTDEILLAILDKNRISSLTKLASDPNFSNIANQVPNDIPLLDLNVEAILDNYPDIVFAANWSEAGKVEQLRNTGIQVYLVNTPHSIKDIQAEIIKLGKILNIEDQAETLAAQMDEDLAGTINSKTLLAEQNWVALDYNSWGTASGVNTTWNAVLEASGIINGSADYEQGSFGQVTMSKELIVEINPDILFLPGWVYGEGDAANAFYEQIANDPALSNVKAIKNKQIYQVPEALRGTYSQYIIDTIEYVVDTVAKDIR